MSTTKIEVNKQENLAALIRQPAYTSRFEAVLKNRAPIFLSSLLQVGNDMPQVEPRSIIAAGMMAASLDLPINKSLGTAWIVPYKTTVKIDGVEVRAELAQFQIGYKGYIQLALRSGTIARMNATAINKEAIAGYDDIVGEPLIDWKKLDTTKPAVAFAFAVRLTNGFGKCAVWTVEECQAHAQKFSQSFRSGAKIWREHRDAMFLKTVISNELRTWVPLSIDIQRALFVDQSAAIDVDAETTYVDNPFSGLIGGGSNGGGNAEPGPEASATSTTSPESDAATEAEMGLGPSRSLTAGDGGASSSQPQKTQAQRNQEAEDMKALQEAEARRKQRAAQTAEPATTKAAAAASSNPPPKAASSDRQSPKPASGAGPQQATRSTGLESPQELIRKGCIEHGISFDQFRKWASEQLPNADSIADFDELPTERCKTWLYSGAALFEEVLSNGGAQ